MSPVSTSLSQAVARMRSLSSLFMSLKDCFAASSKDEPSKTISRNMVQSSEDVTFASAAPARSSR